MCRIYGYLGNKLISDEILHKASISQIKGGPDAQYLKKANGWALGNNRLAVQGLDGGVQPFYLNKINVVYNGEIYNHKELRNFLITKGYTFSDNCDGSVIIPLYELYGEDFFKHLDGMFVITIIDDRANPKLIMVNDLASIKSLYYYWDKVNDILYFSSELISLFVFDIPKKLRLEAVDEYLIGRAIWNNKTFFEDIYSLAPAALLIKTNGEEPKLSQYASSISNTWDSSLNFKEASTYLHHLLEKEITKMVQSDVRVCLVTSGGLDSSYITALASKHISDLHCFNVAYEGNWPSDERFFAQEVSNYCGAKYHQVFIKENEFPNVLKQTIHHLGQPNSAPHSLSTYALFKAVNEAGFKITITGEGADEYFGGYERFRKATFNHSPSWIDEYFDSMCATTQEMRDIVYTKAYKDFLNSSKYNIFANVKKEILLKEKAIGRLKALLQFEQNERFSSYILRRVDHLSMANSVEVRVPFCQPRISLFSKSLPNNFLLNKNSVKKIIYQAAYGKLPPAILTRPKQPFTLPITVMLQKGFILFDILYSTLNSKLFLSRGFFNNDEIKLLINKHLEKPTAGIADLLWSIMVLELWLQHVDLNLSL